MFSTFFLVLIFTSLVGFVDVEFRTGYIDKKAPWTVLLMCIVVFYTLTKEWVPEDYQGWFFYVHLMTFCISYAHIILYQFYYGITLIASVHQARKFTYSMFIVISLLSIYQAKKLLEHSTVESFNGLVQLVVYSISAASKSTEAAALTLFFIRVFTGHRLLVIS